MHCIYAISPMYSDVFTTRFDFAINTDLGGAVGFIEERSARRICYITNYVICGMVFITPGDVEHTECDHEGKELLRRGMNILEDALTAIGRKEDFIVFAR